MSFNKIIIIGNLGRDPELRYTPQGVAVCTFTMATNEKRKDKAGNLQEVVTWFRVTSWRTMAENINKYQKKGSLLYIEGRLRVDEWTDRDNVQRYTLDVQATDCQFLGDNRQEGHTQENQTQEAPQENPTESVEAGGSFSGPPQPGDDTKWQF